MKRLLQFIITVLLVAVLGVVVHLRVPAGSVPASVGNADPAVSAPADTSPSAAVPEDEPDPTPAPEPVSYTISVIGDQTLATNQYKDGTPYSYAARMNGDYAYPFSNTVQYFESDDFTISNLECTLADNKLYSAQQFYFRAPSDYANILIEGGVDFVTTANNHMLDFGQTGLDFTWKALEDHGIPYGKEDEAQIITTDSGLKLGIYCAYNDFQPDKNKAAAAIRQLRDEGAEYIICAYHWGQELYYHPNASQTDIGHAAIDAGADLVYGTHTHCLQPIEEYKGGIILYSMGNWSFGGHTAPTDRDTAIVQVSVKRDVDGSISNDGYTIIPCCVSSRPVNEGYTGDNYNDYCPTPYTEGSDAYNRVLSKLDGSYQADKEGRDYSDVYASYS